MVERYKEFVRRQMAHKSRWVYHNDSWWCATAVGTYAIRAMSPGGDWGVSYVPHDLDFPMVTICRDAEYSVFARAIAVRHAMAVVEAHGRNGTLRLLGPTDHGDAPLAACTA